MTLCSSYLSLYCKDKILKKAVLYMLYIYSFMVMAFRYNVGTDYQAYYEIYEGTFKGKVDDIFYNVLNDTCYGIGLPFCVFIVVTVIFIYLFFIKKEYNNYESFLLFVLLCYLPALCVIRQFIGLAFCMIALVTKSKIKRAILFLTACLFHKSFLFFIGIYLITKLLKIKKISAILAVIIFFVLFYFTRIFETFFTLVVGNSFYSYYLLTENFTKPKGSGLGVVLQFAAFLILFSALDKRKAKENSMAFIIIELCLLISAKIVIFSRLSIMTYPFCFLMIRSIPDYKNKMLFIIPFYLLLTSVFLNQIRVSLWGCMPYQTILNVW